MPSNGQTDGTAGRSELALAVDADGLVTSVGRGAATALGVDPTAARGTPFRALFRPHSRLAADALVVRCDGRTRILETAVGIGRHGAVAAVAKRIGSVAVVHVIDVTMLFGRALDGDRFFEASIDLICTLGLDGYFARVSPSFTTVLGWSEDEFLVRPLMSFVHAADADATIAWLDGLATGAPSDRFENRLATRDGDWRVLQWTSQIDAETGQAYAIARDVTAEHLTAAELTRALDAAEVANQAKSTFLARMSHELRTPLNAILGYSEMLLEDTVDPVAATDLGRINEAGQQLLDLINGILDLSKIESGAIDVFIEPFPIDELVEAVAATVHPLAIRTGNRFEVRLEATGRLQSDRRKLQQILLNLLANATRFTRDGEIVLRVTEVADAVEFAVEDTGVGMTEDDLERAFHPFRQGNHAVEVLNGGTGLGLPIADRFCRLIGAHLAARSKPGSGSCFTIRVPRTHEAPPGRVEVTGGYLVLQANNHLATGVATGSEMNDDVDPFDAVGTADSAEDPA